MSTPRTNLDTIRTQYQVPDDEVITYRPRAFGAVDIPFTSGRQMTKTEGELLDSLTLRRGMLGLSEFKASRVTHSREALSASPTTPYRAALPRTRRANGKATTDIAMRSVTPSGARA